MSERQRHAMWVMSSPYPGKGSAAVLSVILFAPGNHMCDVFVTEWAGPFVRVFKKN